MSVVKFICHLWIYHSLSSIEINNMSAHPTSHSCKAGDSEAEVEHLTQLLSTVVNRCLCQSQATQPWTVSQS